MLSQLLNEAVLAARKAGELQMKYFRQPYGLEVANKTNDADIVTVADRESESLIIECIRHRFPTHAILSEESGESGSGAEYRWVIDPLDGTTNFAAGLPLFNVSIAVEDAEGNTVVGVVFAPYLNELFTAVRGQGAYLNYRRLHCSGCSSLSRAVLATGFPIDKNVNSDNNLANVGRLLPLVRGMRRLGSAALDLCYVGAGFLDGYWELNLHRWDIAAGRLIATEGGALFDYIRPEGERGYSVVAAPKTLMPQLRPLLQ